MARYFFKRLFLIVPTLLGILLLNFLLVQALPGGPVEAMLARIQGAGSPLSQISGESSMPMDGGDSPSSYAGSQGLDPEFIAQLERQFGFDKPVWHRFTLMVINYLTFDLGTSYFRGQKVVDLFLDKAAVSLSLGLWSTLIIYLISLPLGIAKAVRDGSRFDVATSMVIIIGYALPSFLVGILLIVLFSGGSFWDLFPLRGIVSDGWSELPWTEKITDYVWHMTLPLLTIIIGGFASLTLMTKNSFLEEMTKNYVQTARAKGVLPNRVLYGHVLRNAMLVVVAGLPTALVHVLFTSALLTEVIFSLDGLGLLGFEAALNRDYPIMFGILYVYSLSALLLNLLGDFVYTYVDPRINFNKKMGT